MTYLKYCWNGTLELNFVLYSCCFTDMPFCDFWVFSVGENSVPNCHHQFIKGIISDKYSSRNGPLFNGLIIVKKWRHFYHTSSSSEALGSDVLTLGAGTAADFFPFFICVIFCQSLSWAAVRFLLATADLACLGGMEDLACLDAGADLEEVWLLLLDVETGLGALKTQRHRLLYPWKTGTTVEFLIR